LYQGLAYKSLGLKEKAKVYLKNSAQFPDPYGGRAMYEVGILEYNDKNDERAHYWLSLCIQRNPQSPFRPQAMKVLSAIRTGKRITRVADEDEPDVESALFKYNKLSLMPNPHFWFAEIGGSYTSRTLQDKDDQGVFTDRTDEYQAIVANVGVGLGPIKKDEATAWIGYTYLQNWNTTSERIGTYADDPSDISYQPFRTDLLERRHQFSAELSRTFPFSISVGAYTRFEFARIGSSLFSGPETTTLDQEVQTISDTTLFVPWTAYRWNKNFQTLGYLYFRKEINSEVKDFSNKSFDFEGSDGDSFPFSLGLVQEARFPKQRLEASAEFYSYKFVSNDPWLDYRRVGGNGTLEHQVIPQLFVDLSGGLFSDTYPEKILKIGSCEAYSRADDPVTPKASGTAVDETIADCFRDETGWMIRAATYWSYSQFNRIGGQISYVSDSNPVQQEFNSDQLSLMATISIAFPSTRRAFEYAYRFTDSVFAKKDQ
jgi:hypothetical protein